MTVLLSLLAAASYGLGDFNGGIVSKRGGPWAVSLVAQLSGTALVGVVVLVHGGSPDRTDLAWALLAGLGNGFGTAFLYRGLASGRMGVVARCPAWARCSCRWPSASSPGPLPDVSMWAGVALGLPAIWLVSRESGALGALATGLFQVATHDGYLSVAAVITALYSAFTVLLAALVLRERVHAAQGVGLGLCAVSVALVAAS